MAPLHTGLTDRFDLRLPVIQAPMAGVTTVDMVAAVCEAGGLGFLAVAYSSPDEILAMGREVRSRTSRPFGINLFAPVPTPPPPADPSSALALLEPFHHELGIDPPRLPERVAHDHREQFEAALQTGAAMLSFTFGTLPADEVAAAQRASMLVAGTATTVQEALILEASGVEAVVVQGSEAGSHRGTFAGDFARSMVGTMTLVPQVAAAVRIPVIAAGGIMDGRGIVAACALGAEAAQLGTAFLTTDESAAPDAHKTAILDASEDLTTVTTAFSGRPARAIVNRFVVAADQAPAGSILAFPYQNALTRQMRTAAAQRGVADMLSLWAGQGVRMARRGTVRELLARLEIEMATTVEKFDASPA